ncbi:phosphoenolpyruvate--protein phosphotransferase [Allonocardiopsis opalescens]|uniref:Phosphoenolpyruvate-protein phosphotransferase n=1 Tax=Allonocardiopsis opalescens TaxID=1144618 RepID=A0A2T0QC94_9ACTN|nr:phosphoenolpyruvate--protein phosphotransferase [Allonocardiopsis opalescens]PRY01532.1 phosphoenolpyruvate--protein phosphotransferase [Allonocardiopsis opalescens]
MPEPAAAVRGVGVSAGLGVGPVLLLAGAVPEPSGTERFNGDAETAVRLASEALEATAADLEARGAAAGGEAQEVLGAQALMARDPGLADAIKERAVQGATPARAVFDAFARFRKLLESAGGYLGARVADLDDIRDRTVARLLGVPVPGVPEVDHPFVLVARDLAPADTAVLDPARVLAFVTEEGGPTSHTAILARAMGVPAVVAAAGATSIPAETRVMVDGSTGEVHVDPEEGAVEAARALIAARAAAAEQASGPGRTRDGHPVALLANIGGPKDIAAALEHGAEGVGLYRTEFLFLDRAAPPSLDEQRDAYRAALDAFPGGKVVVRVLDAGADKPLAFLSATDEPNPALGVRGLRILRRHPDVLATQLAALVAAAEGTRAELQVMAPMVADAEEAAWFAATAGQAGVASAGVMVEVPIAALRARDLAGEVDFFSIGTNDLAQYAAAADRQVGSLSAHQDPWQPGLLDLVAATAEAAGAVGKPCGVCGEAAADPALACVLAGLGVTSLSMGASALPLVRVALASNTHEQCRNAAAAARAARSADQARAAARAELPGLAELGL